MYSNIIAAPYLNSTFAGDYEVCSFQMEARNLILCPHPLRQPNFEESRDQPQPGSFPKKDPGYEVGSDHVRIPIVIYA